MKSLPRLTMVLALALASGSAFAQTTREALIGGWSAVSVIDRIDGKDTEIFGPNPLGYMAFDANGRFTIQLFRSDLPKLASNNRTRTSPEESAAIAQGLVSYFGSWKLVNPQSGEIAVHIEGSSFPNWNGTAPTRFMAVQGERLTVRNPATSAGGTATVSLQRVR